VVFFCLQYLKELLQQLIDNFNKSIEEAQVYRKSSTVKTRNYKTEYAKGQKHAYANTTKQLTKALSKF
jgi:predicted transcriptional regulator